MLPKFDDTEESVVDKRPRQQGATRLDLAPHAVDNVAEIRSRQMSHTSQIDTFTTAQFTRLPPGYRRRCLGKRRRVHDGVGALCSRGASCA